MAGSLILFGISLLAVATTTRAQVLTPIDISFPTDGGVNAVLPLNDSSQTVVSPVGGSIYVYYQQGELPDDEASGLPDNGEIVNPTTQTIFQLQPYDGLNALNLNGTITLQTPAAYSTLGFLVNSFSRAGRGSSPVTFLLNFSDGSHSAYSTAGSVPLFSDDPTSSGGSVAYEGTGFYDTSLQAADLSTFNLDEYDFALSATDSSKVLESIKVEAFQTELVTYAVSGIDPALPTPEPGAVSLFLAGLGLVTCCGCAGRSTRRPVDDLAR